MRYFFSLVCFVLISFYGVAQVVPADSASQYVGKTIVAYGTVIDGRYLANSTNKPTLLNIGGKFPNQKLTVVIYGNDRVNFGYKPEEMLINRLIYVSGKIELYRDMPQIVVTGPFDISFSNPNPQVIDEPHVEKRKRKENNSSDNGEADKPVVKEPAQKKEEVSKVEKIKPIEQQTQADLEMTTESEENRNEIKKKSDKSGEKKGVEITGREKANTKSNTSTEDNLLPLYSNIIEGATITLPVNVKLRSGPGNQFLRMGKLKKGTAVIIISISGDWVKIKEKKAGEETFAVTGYTKVESLQ
jgi:hypothetical protein